MVDESPVLVLSLSEKECKFIFTLLFCFLWYQPRILLMFSISIPPPLLELDCYWSVSPLTHSLSSSCVPGSPGHGSVRSSPAPSTNTGLLRCPVCFLGLHWQDHYAEWVKSPSRGLGMFKSQCRTFHQLWNLCALTELPLHMNMQLKNDALYKHANGVNGCGSFLAIDCD